MKFVQLQVIALLVTASSFFGTRANSEEEKVKLQHFIYGVVSFASPSHFGGGASRGIDSKFGRFSDDDGRIRIAYEWTFDGRKHHNTVNQWYSEIVRQWKAAGFPEKFTPKTGGGGLGSVMLTRKENPDSRVDALLPNYLYLMCEKSGNKMGYLCFHLRFSDAVQKDELHSLMESVRIVSPEQ